MSDVRTKWGRTKLGDGRFPAMGIALPMGVILAGLLGLGASFLMDSALGQLAIWGIFALCLLPPSVLLVWVLVVDRETMRGAAERPEESIESHWYDRAAAGSQTDVITLAGIAAMVITLLPDDLLGESKAAVLMTLVVVIGAAFLSFAIRYFLLQKRG